MILFDTNFDSELIKTLVIAVAVGIFTLLTILRFYCVLTCGKFMEEVRTFVLYDNRILKNSNTIIKLTTFYLFLIDKYER